VRFGILYSRYGLRLYCFSELYFAKKPPQHGIAAKGLKPWGYKAQSQKVQGELTVKLTIFFNGFAQEPI
jgi:hypothetical protein